MTDIEKIKAAANKLKSTHPILTMLDTSNRGPYLAGIEPEVYALCDAVLEMAEYIDAKLTNDGVIK